MLVRWVRPSQRCTKLGGMPAETAATQEILGRELGALRPGMTLSDVLRRSISDGTVENDTETH